MNLPTVFETCVPREDVLKGTIADADFAADLAKVIRGIAPDDYQKPGLFFANTYPTQGSKTSFATFWPVSRVIPAPQRASSAWTQVTVVARPTGSLR